MQPLTSFRLGDTHQWTRADAHLLLLISGWPVISSAVWSDLHPPEEAASFTSLAECQSAAHLLWFSNDSAHHMVMVTTYSGESLVLRAQPPPDPGSPACTLIFYYHTHHLGTSDRSSVSADPPPDYWRLGRHTTNRWIKHPSSFGSWISAFAVAYEQRDNQTQTLYAQRWHRSRRKIMQTLTRTLAPSKQEVCRQTNAVTAGTRRDTRQDQE